MSDLIEIRLSAEQTEGTRATLAQWLFQPGDAVQAGDPVVELETDKVMMEVAAPADGTLQEQHLQAGDEVTPDKIIGTISTETVSKVTNPENIGIQPETPKTENELISTASTAGQPKTSSTTLSPAVRRLLRQHQINPEDIPGSGRNQRITTRDVQAHLDTNTPLHEPQSEAAADDDFEVTEFTEVTTEIEHDLTADVQASTDEPWSPASSEASQMVPHSAMRQSIARHMVDSLLHTAPHVTSVFDLDMSAIARHRQQHKAGFAERGAKLTFTAYFIAAAVEAIRHEPKVNARFHTEALEIFRHMHIGVGTALGDAGLVVPVIRHCENLDLFGIAQELTRLTALAREGRLQKEHVSGGTFTLSNHGVSGSLVATPIIINQPQSAILGIGKMEKRVVVREVDGQDAILIRPMCYVSLTIDHRALDAHQTNRFLTSFVDTLENWVD